MAVTFTVEATMIKSAVKVASLLVLLLCQSAYAKTTAIVVTGIGGNEEYAEQFLAHGNTIVEALRSVADNNSDIELLSGLQANRDAILERIEYHASLSGDVFMLFLIGHGTVDAETWRFNIPGPDVTTSDLVSSLAVVTAPKQLVVAATSASGAILDVLSQPGRHVVTATKSGGQVNAVRFPEYLAVAMESSVADVDRNELLTLAEVWRYSNEQTQNYYKDKKLIAAEQARINSDAPNDITLARLGALKHAKDNPVVAALLDERLILEAEFASLKSKKPTMDTQAFYAALEPLLVSIAKLQQKIDLATGWGDSNE